MHSTRALCFDENRGATRIITSNAEFLIKYLELVRDETVSRLASIIPVVVDSYEPLLFTTSTFGEYYKRIARIETNISGRRL